MNKIKITSAIVICLLAMQTSGLRAQAVRSPDALVADLYRVHNHKQSPFFQTRSRAALYKYFTRNLADMIFNDAVKSKGEVGVIDGDPLYDAQDMEIKKFAIGKANYENGKARVTVRFENFDEKKTIVFLLIKTSAAWRIDNIDYGGGRTLRSEFKSGA